MIYNPEVMVIHTPTIVLDRNLRTNCFKVLRAYVDERGLEMPPKKKMMRRPRTLIFSTAQLEGIKIADKILYCAAGTARDLTYDAVMEEVQKAEGAGTLGSLRGQQPKPSAPPKPMSSPPPPITLPGAVPASVEDQLASALNQNEQLKVRVQELEDYQMQNLSTADQLKAAMAENTALRARVAELEAQANTGE
jgi:hypothetical protein